jgi:hypothetical protein
MYRVSKLWHCYKLFPGADNHILMDSLHHKYGDFVRTGKLSNAMIRGENTEGRAGPNEISVSDPRAILAIYGPKSKCIKAPLYDISPPYSVQTMRDRVAHDKRRKVWDQGFGAKGSSTPIPLVFLY